MDAERSPEARFPSTFFLLAFGFTWAILVPAIAARSLPGPALVAVAQFGPSVAAFMLVFKASGWRGVRRLAGRALDYRIPIPWLLTILLLPTALAGGAFYLNAALGNPAPPTPLLAQPLLIPAYFVFILLLQGPVPEEFGWRGYALDRLQARWPALTASLVLGLIWGVWHLPGFFIPGVSQSYMSFWAFLVLTVSFSVLITWVYNNTGRNLLAALLAHTMVNLSAYGIFPPMELKAGASQSGLLLVTAAYAVAALAVVLIWGPGTLVRPPRGRPAKVTAVPS